MSSALNCITFIIWTNLFSVGKYMDQVYCIINCSLHLVCVKYCFFLWIRLSQKCTCPESVFGNVLHSSLPVPSDNLGSTLDYFILFSVMYLRKIEVAKPLPLLHTYHCNKNPLWDPRLILPASIIKIVLLIMTDQAFIVLRCMTHLWKCYYALDWQ